VDAERHVSIIVLQIPQSSIQHSIQDSTEPRSGHIPGYAGFIPKNRAESIHGKTFADKTK